jgi:hypothetical protein
MCTGFRNEKCQDTGTHEKQAEIGRNKGIKTVHAWMFSARRHMIMRTIRENKFPLVLFPTKKYFT